MRRHFAVLGVVFLVVLAGCSGLPMGDDGADAPLNDTEGDAPTDELTYPAGYDESGVANASEVLATHDAAIADRPTQAQTTIRLTIPGENDGEEDVQQLSMETQTDGTGTEYARIELTESVAETYRSGDGVVYTRIDDGENVQYTADDVETPDALSPSTFGEALAVADLSLDNVSEDEPRRLTYSGSGVLDEETSFGDVEDVETEVVVDEDGAIHSFSVSYTVPDGADVEASFEFEYDDVTVEEPDWLDEAAQTAG